MVNADLTQLRSHWMAVLAKAPLSLLEKCMGRLGTLPEYGFLRSPEIGLAMVRGRAEGNGQPFNLGEMTITRCVVQLTSAATEHSRNGASANGASTSAGLAGFGYVAGRSQRHAELAAICDALLQHPSWQATVQTQVLKPLHAAALAKRNAESAEVESTRVNFFTLLRGES